jgi:hypothetical protein
MSRIDDLDECIIIIQIAAMRATERSDEQEERGAS